MTDATPSTPENRPSQGKIYIIAERQPAFPCWLWGRHRDDGDWSWFRVKAYQSFIQKSSHWHPDQPTAPTTTPEGSA